MSAYSHLNNPILPWAWRMTCEYMMMCRLHCWMYCAMTCRWLYLKLNDTVCACNFISIQCICLEIHISFYPVVLFIHDHLHYRDTADDFIAAHRLSDMLVKINLDESTSRNHISIVGRPPTLMRSVHGRPSELGTGKNSFFNDFF